MISEAYFKLVNYNRFLSTRYSAWGRWKKQIPLKVELFVGIRAAVRGNKEILDVRV